MQTTQYAIHSGRGITLWRGIPAQIEISGVEDTSGNWLFLADNDFSDGVVLSGTVAASAGKLTVTLENMNTVELAEAINGRALLQCRATLTDSESRVFLIPVTVCNRSVSGTPTPVQEFYDKAQIDAMIAAIPAQVQSNWNETDPASKAFIQNKPTIPDAQVQSNWNETDPASKAFIQNKPTIPDVPVRSVNGATGAVVLDAEDVGAVSSDGLPIVALSSGTIPDPGAVYTITLSSSVIFTFPTPVSGKENLFEIDLTMPDPAVTVTWPSGLTWKFATPSLSAGTTTALRFRHTGTAWEGWCVPDMSEYALAANYVPKTGGDFTGPINIKGLSVNLCSLSLYSNNVLRAKIDGGSISCGWAPTTTNATYGVFAVGFNCTATGGYGCGSLGNQIINTGDASLFVGAYNVDDSEAAFAVGNGTANNRRANCFTIKKTGEAVLAGDLTFTPSGGTATTLSALVARIEALEQAIQ